MATRTVRTRKRAAPLLPAVLADLLKRRGLQGLGGVMVLSGLALMLALMSYRGSDSSWQTATGGVPENLLGLPGASIAQVLWMFGWCGPIPAVALITWGGQIMRWLSLDRLRWRLLAVIAVMVMGPGGTTALLGKPLAAGVVGMGGSVGYFLASQIEAVTAALGLSAWILAVPLIGASLALMPFALGLPLEDMRAIGGAVARAGRWLLHAAMATLADAVRWTSWRVEALRLALSATPKHQTRRAHRRDTAATATAPLMPNRTRDTGPAAPDTSGPDRANKAEKIFDEPEVAEILGKSAPRPSTRESRERQGTLRLDGGDGMSLPPLDLLESPDVSRTARNRDTGALQQNARMLESVLDDFGVHGKILRGRNGPVVTRYELEPSPGTRSSRVISLADDIARSMSAVSARVAVVPGQNAIGIELPNRSRETVYLRELLASEAFERSTAALPLVLGKDISGEPSVVDLARMPHLLVAGTTGSGKSVAINSMILSLVYRLRADECKFIMIDPKMLELSVYDGIPHLLHPVVVDPSKAVVALKWAVKEMNARYRQMSNLNVRNIAGYNKRLAQARAKGEELTKTVQTGFHPETGKPMYEKQAMDMEPLPLLVIIVDEMADLMLVAGKDIEVAVQSLAQKARAAGIHLIIATQRPSVDVITGTIKANLPTRISFQVTSKIDSRTILGEQGAEQLLGMGDMLYMAGGSQIHRVHGPYVSEEEVEEVANFLRAQGEPQYLESITDDIEESGAAGGLPAASSGDALFDQAVALVARERKASTSFVQRHLQIGYNRAARLIERMEAEGMISKANHVGKREVLLPEQRDMP